MNDHRFCRFLNWSSQFACREFFLGSLFPLLFAYLVLSCGGCVFHAFLEGIGFLFWFLAIILPFFAKTWREAFEISFTQGRCLPPWYLRTLTVLSLMMTSLAFLAHGYEMFGSGLALLTVEDAAFFSWIAVFRHGKPEIPIAR